MFHQAWDQPGKGDEDIMVKMQGKTIAGLVAAAMLVAVPLVPAEAHDHDRGRGGDIGLGILGAAVIGSVAALAAGAQPVQPVYAAPVYAPPPVVYYAPQPQVYYAPPPPVVYYAPGYYSRY